MEVDLVGENGAEPDEGTLADATELADRIFGALCEAGRPDIAERVFIGVRDDGIYRPGVRTLWLSKAEQRLAHRAFVIVGDYRYCFRCWRTGRNGCRAGALEDCGHNPLSCTARSSAASSCPPSRLAGAASDCTVELVLRILTPRIH